MKYLYSNDNTIILHSLRAQLEHAGFKTFIKNEFASGAMGELAPTQAWPELWLYDDNDYQPALNLIEQSQKDNDTLAQSEWLCSACHEINAGNFAVCWNCQHVKENNEP